MLEAERAIGWTPKGCEFTKVGITFHPAKMFLCECTKAHHVFIQLEAICMNSHMYTKVHDGSTSYKLFA